MISKSGRALCRSSCGRNLLEYGRLLLLFSVGCDREAASNSSRTIFGTSPFQWIPRALPQRSRARLGVHYPRRVGFILFEMQQMGFLWFASAHRVVCSGCKLGRRRKRGCRSGFPDIVLAIGTSEFGLAFERTVGLSAPCRRSAEAHAWASTDQGASGQAGSFRIMGRPAAREPGARSVRFDLDRRGSANSDLEGFFQRS